MSSYYSNRVPKSKNTGRFRHEDTGNHQNMEAVFPPEIFRIFSNDFRPISRRKAHKIGWNPPEKNPENSHWNTASTSGDFRCILQNPVTFPLVFSMFRWDPVAGMFDLGTTISRLSLSFLTQSKQTITNFKFQNFSAFFQKNFRLLGGGLPLSPSSSRSRHPWSRHHKILCFCR